MRLTKEQAETIRDEIDNRLSAFTVLSMLRECGVTLPDRCTWDEILAAVVAALDEPGDDLAALRARLAEFVAATDSGMNSEADLHAEIAGLRAKLAEAERERDEAMAELVALRTKDASRERAYDALHREAMEECKNTLVAVEIANERKAEADSLRTALAAAKLDLAARDSRIRYLDGAYAIERHVTRKLESDLAAAQAEIAGWQEKARNWLASPEAAQRLDGYRELAQQLAEAREERDARSNHPDRCPITGLPFFMGISHPERGWVATYGGPYDSYTIPERDSDDGDLTRERYDHDADGWVEGCESIGLSIVSEEDLSAAREREEGLREALDEAIKTLDSVRVFVTSRERIARDPGEEWYDERVRRYRRALAAGGEEGGRG